MFGLPLPTVVIIAAITGLALSMIPWKKLAELKASIPEIPDNSKPDVDPSAKYLEAQKKLLEIRVICKDCQEATAAIDAAIKATVAMVVKPKTELSVSAIPKEWQIAAKVASMQAMADAALASPSATAEVKQ